MIRLANWKITKTGNEHYLWNKPYVRCILKGNPITLAPLYYTPDCIAVMTCAASYNKRSSVECDHPGAYFHPSA